MTTTTQWLETAKFDLGKHEEPPGSNVTQFGRELGLTPAAWCMQWVSHVMRAVGFPIPQDAQHPGLGWSSVGFFLEWARKNHLVVTSPIPGDVVCFDWDNNGKWPDHVGIVVDIFGNGDLYTIEGNALRGVINPVDGGDQVGYHRRPRNINVMAYVRLPLEGVAAPMTLDASLVATSRNVSPYPWLPNGVLLKQGTWNNDHVAIWQQRMKQRGWRITIDGDYGPQSSGIARQFQKEKRLEVDGVVGPKTWSASWEAPIT